MRTALLLLLVYVAMPSGLRAQAVAVPGAAPAAAAPTLTPGQAQGVLDVLRDDKRRAEFEGTLENMVHALPAASAEKPAVVVPNSLGAELLSDTVAWSEQLGAQFEAAAEAIGDVPLLWRWVEGTVADPASLERVSDAAWRLVVIVAAARAVEWGVRRALGRTRAFLAGRAPADEPIPDDHPELAEDEVRAARRGGLSVAWRMLRRLPFVLAALAVNLVPVAVFAAVSHLMLSTPLGARTNTRLLVLDVVDAILVCRVAMCVTRMFVSPVERRLRLVQCDDAAARFIERWVRRVIAVAAFGYAAAEIGLLFGLYRSAHEVLVKLVALAVHIMLVIVVVRSRRAVAHRLRARRGRQGTLASLQNHLAARWHLIAIFYIAALWLVEAAQIQNGYERLLTFAVETTGTVITARLASIVLLGALDRSVRGGDAQGALQRRLLAYYPVVRSGLIALLSVATGLALLEIWGYRPASWFSGGQLGERLVSALGTSAVTVLVAVIVWEAANAGVERKVDSLTRAAQTARAARLRTLLPMLRTALLVTILVIAGLVVLSQVGLNIAPLLAGAGVLGVAIGFGSQKLVQDLITGLFLLLENTMQVGDVVTLAGLTGTVEYLSVRTIRLRALDGAVHIIPFSSVTTVTNQTRDFAFALIDLPIGLDEEPDRVTALLAGIAMAMRKEVRWQDAITADLESMGVYAFADHVWTLRVRIRTTPSQRWAVSREFNRRVKYCFDENAVQSPITAYKVQGWLPPGAERPMPMPKTPEPHPVQEAAQ